MLYQNLKKRIKKNEGFSKTPYKDQLGKPTIGYGHLIKKKETYLVKDKINKKKLKQLFEADFKKAIDEFNKKFSNHNFNKKEKELLIEMIFQLGISGTIKFKKMIYNLKNKKRYLAALEMMNSLWYKQTPRRVDDLIINFLKK